MTIVARLASRGRGGRMSCAPTQATVCHELSKIDRRLRRVLVELASAHGEHELKLREELALLGLKQVRLAIMKLLRKW